MKRIIFFCEKTRLMGIMFAAAMLISASSVFAQSLSVSGQVTDPTGEPLIGATVVVQGTTVGTVTDFDGNYQLQADAKAMLEFSYVGYLPQVVAVEGRSVISVQLKDDSQMLEQVVVIGYGSLSKKEVSSSIVQVDAKDFNKGAMNNPMEMLQGKIAGLNVATTAAADPNSSSDLQIRGAGSLTASNSPLVVIDGIAGGDIRNIAAQDIESITVLKDAGSAAIYGTRGANGVILVTTKKGAGNEAGSFTVTYDSYFDCNVANARPETLTADEFRRSRRGTDYGYETDWYSQIIKPATYDLNQYIAINGSTKQGYYAASFNFKDAKGLDIISARREYGARFAAEQKFLGDHLVLSGSLSGRRVNETWGNNGQVDNALNLNPTMPVYNEDGSYYQPTHVTNATNPVTVLKETKSEGKRMYLLGNVDLKYNIWHNENHNISTNVNYALQYNDLKSDYYSTSKSNDSYWAGVTGTAHLQYQKWQTHRVEWLLNYGFQMDDHTLKFVGGYSWERSWYESMYEENKNFAFDYTLWNSIQSGTYLGEGKASMTSYKNETTLIGFFGRLNYNWRDMLFASASFRREGSTKFGVNNKWGNFPSASLAWEMMSCSFMDNASHVVKSLKPRVSYGVTGRADFDPYKSMPLYGPKDPFFMDGNWVIGYAPTANANPDLKWERNIVINAGIDFDLWGRLRGSIEYYNRQSKDLLYNYSVPRPPYVYEKMLVNVGSTANQGIEVVLNGDVIKTKDFTWNMGVNYSWGKTKLTKLSSDVYKADYMELYNKGGVGSNEYLFRVEEGGYIGQFYGYQYAGVNEKGDLMVVSYAKIADSKGRMPGEAGYEDTFSETETAEPVLASQANLKWKRYIGNGAPQHFLSWNNSWTYKNWDFSMMWRGAMGFDIYNQRRYGMGLIANGADNVLKTAYTKEEVTGDFGGVFSNYFLEKGDYFKLDNITIGYNFTAKEAKYFQNCRLYLTAKNICTLTAYSGNDPAIVPSTGITPGVDSGSAYPTATQLSLGVTLNLK
ncbi:MAG: SusC/RagA family TonB-linked outer membrane protein [Paludibacteraceae bacterium]|nr:SusC/RagA family TonB-linked outer membrane protein [Paludibacteraceae bacterium]